MDCDLEEYFVVRTKQSLRRCLRKMAWTVSWDDWQELLQSVRLASWRVTVQKYTEPTKKVISKIIFYVCKNVVRQYLAKRKTANVTDSFCDVPVYDTLNEIADLFSEKEKTIAVKLSDGYTIIDIATEMGTSRQYIYRTVNQMRDKLLKRIHNGTL